MDTQKLTTLTSSVIAILIVAGAIGLVAFGIPVPDGMWTGFALVLGFFFGQQTGSAQARAR